MSYTLVPFKYLWKIILQPIIQITDVNKVYASGFQALNNINLTIKTAEIFALLGPNGAGKTTLISTICGIVDASSGQITVAGKDIVSGYRHTRRLIGLVPQELTTDAFETVWTTVSFSRGLFGKKPNPAFIEKTLKSLSLWDKKDNKLIELSGGMKRRVMIAKALSHEPAILFLDEPTAGVDVELRKDMWQLVRQLRDDGVTIILTTHYIEEAEEIADRIGVIKNGQLILVEDKIALMNKLGKKQLILDLKEPLTDIPSSLADFNLQIKNEGLQLIYSYDTADEYTGISVLLQHLSAASIAFKDIKTDQSSLEDIFVSLVRETT
jgi:ABC-2 type transport system ATP-binding protein